MNIHSQLDYSNQLEHPSTFDGNGVTEWNIDGITEHQIRRKIYKITMVHHSEKDY